MASGNVVVGDSQARDLSAQEECFSGILLAKSVNLVIHADVRLIQRSNCCPHGAVMIDSR